MRFSLRRLLVGPLVVLGGLSLCQAAAAGPDWDEFAHVRTIQVLTDDDDGDRRETKVWLAVVDGEGFLRTGDSRWGDNLERDPDLVLRIEGREYALRADPIEDDEFRARIEQAFREKYGWPDALIGLFRFDRPRILHMAPR